MFLINIIFVSTAGFWEKSAFFSEKSWKKNASFGTLSGVALLEAVKNLISILNAVNLCLNETEGPYYIQWFGITDTTQCNSRGI